MSAPAAQGLLVRPSATPDEDGTFVRVTPESAGWGHVGFEVLALAAGRPAARATGDREVCVVVVAGRSSVGTAPFARPW